MDFNKCISMMIDDAEHFSCACWPSLCILWRGKVFSSSSHFFNQVFWIWVTQSVYTFHILTPYRLYYFSNIFSLWVGCVFILLMVSLACALVQKLLSWYHFIIFVFASFALRKGSKYCDDLHQSTKSMSSSRSFMVFSLTFRSLTNFVFIFYALWNMF